VHGARRRPTSAGRPRPPASLSAVTWYHLEPIALTPNCDPLAHHRTVVRTALDALHSLGHRLPGRAADLATLISDSGPGPTWRSAVEAQMQLTGQEQEEAQAVIVATVQQVGALCFQTTWFEDPAMQAAAIEEILRYISGRGRQVRSRAAQEAWRRHWELQKHPPPGLVPKRPSRPLELRRGDQLGEVTIGPASPEIMTYVRQLNRTQAQWLEEWARWAGPSKDDR
jgi:hypothetical protein